MQNTKPRTGNRFGILLTISMGIILTMGIYYMYTQSVKEANVKRQAFKTLYRYAGDLKDREKGVLKAYRYKFKDARKMHEYSKKKNLTNYDQFKKIIKEYNNKKIISKELYKKVDSAARFNLEKMNEKEDCLFFNKITSEKSKTLSGELIDKNNPENTVKYKHKDIFLDDRDNDLLSRYISQDSNLLVSDTDLFADILDNRFFEGFVVFDMDSVIYNQFPNTHLSLKQKKEKQTFSLDSLIHLVHANKKVEFALGTPFSQFEVKNPHELQLSIGLKGEQYQLFLVRVDGVKVKYLGGLMPKSKYDSLKRGFDRGMISAISIFVLLLLLSIPFIRLILVSPGEPYTVRNLLALLISTMGVVYVCAFMVLHFGNIQSLKQHVQPKNDEFVSLEKKGQLHQLSSSINKSFEEEMDVLLKQLNKLKPIAKESIWENGPTSFKNEVKKQVVPSCSRLWLEAFIVHKDTARTIVVYRNENRYKPEDTRIGVNVIERGYIRNPSRFTKKIGSGDFKFGFESIFSLTTAKPEMVVSTMSSNEVYIACLSQEMYSVYNTILPDDYSFCIIDGKGKVWFHEDPKNNVRENLFTETDDHPNLLAATKSLRADVFMARYKMKETLMHIEPLDADLGLFTVTMCSMNNYRQIVNQTGYILIGASLLLLLFWLIAAQIYRKCVYRSVNAKYLPHGMMHFFPHPEKYHLYLRMGLTNGLFALVMLLISVLAVDSLYVIHWVALLAIGGALLLIWNISQVDGFDQWRSPLSRRHMVVVSIAVFLFIVIDLLIPHKSCSGWSFRCSLFILLGICAIPFTVLIPGNLFPKKLFPTVRLQALKQRYFIYVFSFIVGFVLMPLYSLYVLVYHQEASLYRMHQLRHVADGHINRYKALKKQKNEDTIITWLEKEGNYYQAFHKMKLSKGKVDSSGFACTRNYLNIFGHARTNLFFLNNLIEDRGNRVRPNYFHSNDKKSFYSYSESRDSLSLSVKTGGQPYNHSAFRIDMERASVKDVPRRYLAMLFSLLTVLVLFIVFFPKIARFLFPQFKYDRKLFPPPPVNNMVYGGAGGGLPTTYLVTMPDDAFVQKCLDENGTSHYRLHLHDEMQAFLNTGTFSGHVYLLIGQLVFEDTDQLVEFVNKLELLRRSEYVTGVTIVCFSLPRSLVTFIKDSLQADKSEKKKDHYLQSPVLNRLEHILSTFTVKYLPLTEQPIKKKYLDEKERIKDHYRNAFKKRHKGKKDWANVFGWLDEEFAHNAYLHGQLELYNYGETLTENKQDPYVNKENVYMAYTINRTYYQKIWSTCTPHEKSILYDIAEDYVINLHKNGVVNSLINKGLVKNGQFLSLFNKSFTFFVIRQAAEVDGINEELQTHNKTGWRNYNLPIKLLGVAIVVFLLVTQQEFLTGIQSIIISIAAVLTFVVQFFNSPFRTGLMNK